jgi:hypothetical protein
MRARLRVMRDSSSSRRGVASEASAVDVTAAVYGGSRGARTAAVA